MINPNFIIKKVLSRLRSHVFRSVHQPGHSDAVDIINKITMKFKKLSIKSEKGETWITMANGMKIKCINDMNSIASVILSQGEFEPTEGKLLLKYLHDGAVFIDIGANVGYFSILAAKKYPSIKIHAFEPVPNTLIMLQEHLKLNDVVEKITPHCIALSDYDGFGYMTTSFHASNYLAVKQSPLHEEKINVAKIDTYIKKININRMDVIKIDVEGHELSVINGAIDTIKQFRPVILVELVERDGGFHDRVIQDHKIVIKQMTEMGYNFAVVDDQNNTIHASEIEKAVLQNSFHNYLFYDPNKHKSPIID